MGRLTDLLGKPRTQAIEMSSGATVLIGELPLSATWPIINGAAVDPDVIIRASVIDANGRPLIAADDEIPMALGLELLPAILAFNNLEANKTDGGGEVAELDRDFPRAAPAG